MDSDEQPGTRLRENLRRMFKERGLDFFDQDDEQRQANKPIDDPVVSLQSKDTMNPSSDGQNTESMSPEALSNMRSEIMPQLQYVWQASRFLTYH
jgi:mediator of RNA polymerase II transcription subunit 17